MTGLIAKEAQGKRLRAAREAAGHASATDGWSAVKRLTRSDVSKDTYIQHENGTRSLKNQAQFYGEAFNVDPSWLLWGDGEPLRTRQDLEAEALPQAVNRTVPLIGKVEAGHWAEIPDEPVVEEEIPVWLPEYERARLYALRVSGRSMDLLYPDGVVVVYAPAAETGLRVGDIAVVRRHRGPFAETTLKEIAQAPDGSLILQPRSSDPQYLAIPFPHDQDADNGLEVVGVVVCSIDRTRRGSGPLVML